MVEIYHNSRCRKSRETLAILEEQAEEIQVREYLNNPPSRDELIRVINMLGIEPVKLIRKGEKIYKENYKDKEMDNNAWIDVMLEHPILIERPIVIKGDKAVIGRPPENVQSIL